MVPRLWRHLSGGLHRGSHRKSAACGFPPQVGLRNCLAMSSRAVQFVRWTGPKAHETDAAVSQTSANAVAATSRLCGQETMKERAEIGRASCRERVCQSV